MGLPVQTRTQRRAATWDPLTELEHTTTRLARLLDDARELTSPTMGLRGLDEFVPPADLEETDDAYVLEVELPGVRKDDVEVEVAGRRVTISGERKERERTGILRRRTRTVGRFFHEVVLPGDIDDEAVSARLSDGVLTITVPKAATERQRRRITVH